MKASPYLITLLVTAAVAPLSAQAPPDSLIVDLAGKQVVFHTFEGLPRQTVTVSFHDSAPQSYSGVDLRLLLERAGFAAGRLRGSALAQYIVVEARDGYRVTFGIADLDSALVSRHLVLVDRLAGQPLPPTEGPWRLIVSGDPFGARSARMVSTIRVRTPE